MVVRNASNVKNIKHSLENLLAYFSEDVAGSVDSRTLFIIENELIDLESKLQIYTDNYRPKRKK